MTTEPDGDAELERQRADIETSFREGWRPRGAGQPRVLTQDDYDQARKIITQGGCSGHRFPPDPFAEGREQIWLMEEIDTHPLVFGGNFGR